MISLSVVLLVSRTLMLMELGDVSSLTFWVLLAIRLPSTRASTSRGTMRSRLATNAVTCESLRADWEAGIREELVRDLSPHADGRYCGMIC